MRKKTKYYLATVFDEKITKIITEEEKQTLRLSSYRGPFDSKKELKEHCEMLKEPCKICGGIVELEYTEPLKSELIEDGICFSCHFWKEKVHSYNERTVIVDGLHYRYFDDNPGAAFLGFGGREFRIKFNDGREVVTHNLWHQGNIPERFRDKLPDNAQFIN